MTKQNRLSWFLVIVPVLLLALGIRLHEMNGRSLWFDEAIEYNVAARPLAEIIAADRSSTHDPPLYSLALGVWLQTGRTDLQVRFLSVCASVLAVAITFVLGRRIYSTRAGWFSALLLAVAPRAVYYGFELNQYAFVLLLSALNLLVVERYLQRPTLRHLLVFLITSIASVLTHYELTIYLLALVVVATFSLVLRQARETRVRVIIQWLAGLGVIALVGSVLLWSYALPQKSRLPESRVPVRFNAPISVSYEVRTWLTETDQLLRVLLWGPDLPPISWLAIALLMSGIVVSLWHASSRRLALYFLASLAFAYGAAGIGFFVYSFTLHRNVVYAIPLAALLISGGVFTLAAGRFRRYLTPAAYLVMVIVTVLLASRLPSISGKAFPETEQFGEVMDYFLPRYQAGDGIYVYYGAQPAFTRYADESILKAATIQIWSRNVAPEVQISRMWQALGRKPRVWLLMAHVHPSDRSVLPDALRARCQLIDQFEVQSEAAYLVSCADTGQQ